MVTPKTSGTVSMSATATEPSCSATALPKCTEIPNPPQMTTHGVLAGRIAISRLNGLCMTRSPSRIDTAARKRRTNSGRAFAGSARSCASRASCCSASLFCLAGSRPSHPHNKSSTKRQVRRLRGQDLVFLVMGLPFSATTVPTITTHSAKVLGRHIAAVRGSINGWRGGTGSWVCRSWDGF
jgi:hypothetical protein